MNFLPAELVGSDGDSAQIRVQGDAVLGAGQVNGAATGAGYGLGVRPEHLVEGGAGDASISGPVVAVWSISVPRPISMSTWAGNCRSR
ncbi:MAG: hypothetical protein R3C97_14700 [Geminicoccaceae bacterium]